MTMKIVIDPGHGADLRPTFPDGSCETDIAWSASLHLRDLLADKGHTVLMTKDTRDAAPGISDRGVFAARQGAKVFVSLHCNAASTHSERRGVFGIFYGKHPRENRAPDAEIHAPKGRRLARFIAQEISALTEIPLSGVDGAKLWWRHPANLGVLTAGGNWHKTEAACLLEAGFLTNETDRSILGVPEGQRSYALGCARGIYRYAGLSIPDEWDIAPRADQPNDLEPGEEPEAAIDEAPAAELEAAVQWARSLGLTELTDLTRPITVAELVVTMYRALGK